MNNIVLTMSICGSVSFLLYYVFKFFFQKNISAVFRYRLLKVSMCFYLLPIPLFSEKLRSIVQRFMPNLLSNPIPPEGVWITDLSDTIYETPEGYIFSGHSFQIVLLSLLGLLVTGIILFLYGMNYSKMIKLKRYLSEASLPIIEMTEQLRREFHIHSKITAYSLDESCTPFSYGFFNPKIVISSEYSPVEQELILRHELWHIKSGDFVIRLLALFLLALHFFNPTAWLLFYEIDKVSELACDENVISGFSAERRKQYGYLLLNVVPAPVLGYTNSFSGRNMKILKERIAMIKQPKRTKIATFVCCIGITVFCSVLPAAAYEPVKIEEESDVESVKDVDMYMFAEEDILRDPNEDYFKTGDVFFIDENGAVYFDHGESNLVRADCKHSYKAGALYVHKKKGNGCVYIKYSVKRCSKCAAIKDRKYLNTITYAICLHK